tara:strand:- start:1412 stop:3400 length:1989 start_codon:yes stop_codon:yes gene_type:complete
MCGISGLLTLNQYSNDWYNKTLKTFTDLLSHRGPDSDGIWFDSYNGIGLSHNRLSIIELTALGNQPMLSKDKNMIISFNGEIYNHLKLRNIINKEKKIKWMGNSDTETLIELISHWGLEKTLNKIDGMFAFAIWNNKEKELILARDCFGEKPLYFGNINKNFIFSSELESFKKFDDYDLEINKESLDYLCRLSYVPGPLTIYKNIYKLEHGSYLKIKKPALEKKLEIKKNFQIQNKNLTISKWFNFKNIFNKNNHSKIQNYDEAKNSLKEILFESVENRMISDVEIGTLLSGGIDSSLITAIMSKISKNKIKTFNMGFSVSEYDESQTAKNIANHLGTDHYNFRISENELLDTSINLSEIYSEPFADSSQIPTYILSKNVSNHMKVVLSGDGGDELFGGYNRYVWGPKVWSKLSFLSNKNRFLLSKIMQNTPLNFLKFSNFILNNFIGSKIENFSDKYYKLANKISWVTNQNDLYKSFVSEISPKETFLRNYEFKDQIFNNLELPDNLENDIYQKMMFIDILTYLCDDILCKVDRASMANGLEVRVPFLNKKLLDFSFRLPSHMKISKNINKIILRDIAYDFIPRNILNKPKKGFGVPLKIWLRKGPLNIWAKDLIYNKIKYAEHLLDKDKIQLMWEEHISNKRDWQNRLWPILIFLSWLKN